MTYWIGPRAAIDAANLAAYAAYIAAAPTALRDGETLPNPTTAWAEPLQDAAGNWVIPAHPGMTVPAGVQAVSLPDWPAANTL
ncbi:hypothetical protein [Ketogulonicigenium vulgare]|uniref:Uncharacterized protein n=1 Tax=Ketogulonicigenium vulgare (strain WSH-001) TaxID=759362 RepID=F9Y830_KETVW|nr:hypothetical protein [Ketogulonicigenium vulgare]ADO42973.1 hypothetical protein EIO_1857 [Ketogulonicigenium vulgare Y25]AEM41156.1 hypothetical protein KVU_1318 [Ketogulonicigenium vulgare WSH-001]ALJ81300.1 hypothetical protein KVH_08965 [Ketogulonicigenium vulgare]ANW35068.1 hypothetical protein KvSKV_08920 [Ketogulonicigenium vulgare]AOZ54883.1 hypothetical protein KVC_1876 [Ketogulonicigenium vulgare]